MEILRRIEHSNLYDMQRAYGTPGVYRRVLGTEFDPKTGETIESVRSTSISHLLAFDETAFIHFVQQGYPFTAVEIGDKFFIVSSEQVATINSQRDKIVYDGAVYSFVKVIELSPKAGFVIHGRTTR